MKKKLLNEEGKCPFCGADLDYEAIELVEDMAYYPWRCCADGSHKGEEWYNLTFAGHNVEVDDVGTTIEVSELNKEEK